MGGTRAYATFRRRGQAEERSQPPQPPRTVLRALSAGAFLLQVLAECGQSPGCRIMGVRPVDLHNGRSVGLGRALVRVSVMQASRLGRVPGRARRRREERERRERRAAGLANASKFAEELGALEAQHEGDEEALNRARVALLERHHADSGMIGQQIELRGCLLTLVKQLALTLIPKFHTK
jgi:hypothetical protein